MPDPSPNVIASTHSVRIPIALAIARFCETARMSSPIRVRFNTASRMEKTINVKITM